MFAATISHAKTIQCEAIEAKYTTSSGATELAKAYKASAVSIILDKDGEGSGFVADVEIELTEDSYLKGLYKLIFIKSDGPTYKPEGLLFSTFLKKDQMITNSDLSEMLLTELQLKPNQKAQGYLVMANTQNAAVMALTNKVRKIIQDHNKTATAADRINVQHMTDIQTIFNLLDDKNVKALLAKNNIQEGETIAAGVNLVCIDQK